MATHTSNHLLEIKKYGQSIWMDYLTRDIILSGELEELIENKGISGVTSNPTIFEKAIIGNEIYDKDIEAGVRNHKTIQQVYESLIFADIRNACDILCAIYESSKALDGYVSIEVPPTISQDTQRTIEEARRYYQQINRSNVMVKIPGTKAGFPAIEQATREGINVNVTLLFSVNNYAEAAWAYIRGLEARVADGQDISNISSVASFFLSRIDSKVDALIDEKFKKGVPDQPSEVKLTLIRGKVAIANAKMAYQKYKEIIASERWQALANKGANPQRLLWASTSTKDPTYSKVKYVEELVGSDTVTTLAPKTIELCAEHCKVTNSIETDVDKARNLIASFRDPDIDINLDQVMDELLVEGIDQFIKSFQSLMQSLEEKIKRLAPV
ncbi:transaldolase [Nostocales cyanobacterium HT-58-2]|nr:transaldolase [Nostocales cyanobacterium HT-58-2]